MKIRRIEPTIADAIELPRVIRLDRNLHAAAFSLMKLLPARFILARAHDAGLVDVGTTIIETTSGTFGLALAIVSALCRYRLILVSDPAIDAPLKRRLEELGACVEIVQEPAPNGGFQRSRLNRMAEIQAEHPNHFWPSQYDNPHNPGAYALVAELLVEVLGKIDCLVGPVGSGGSICGISRFLRILYPDLIAIGVDTPNSVLFGQPDNKRLLRGLGNSLMPENLDPQAFDEVHWVSAAEAFLATCMLHRTHAMYMGGTSGAAYLVADWWARQNPDANAVVIFPDEGYRYQETIYNDQWLKANGVWLSEQTAEPHLVDDPKRTVTEWSRFLWNRRTYAEVVAPAMHSEAFR